MKDKMKREKRDHKIVILCTASEYNTMRLLFKKTTCRSLPEYGRKMMMHKPVAVTYRNRSIDDLVDAANASGKLLLRMMMHPGFTFAEIEQMRGQMNDIYQIFVEISHQCMQLLRSRKMPTESSTITSEN
jgi:hypothetical protein